MSPKLDGDVGGDEASWWRSVTRSGLVAFLSPEAVIRAMGLAAVCWRGIWRENTFPGEQADESW